jgi:hypothetical protein
VNQVFEPLNLIERRLAEAVADPSRRVAFGQRLLTEKLYVSPLGPPDAQGHMPGLRAAPQPDGSVAVAFFTAPERVVEAYGPTALILVKDGRTLFDWLAPGPFQINPGSDYTVVLSPADVTALLAGGQPEIAPRPSRLDLGLPFNKPAALIERLRGALEPLSETTAAHLLLAQREGRSAPSWLLGVESQGPWRDVQAAIAAAIQDYDFSGQSLDVMPIEAADSPLRAGLSILAERAPRAALH